MFSITLTKKLSGVRPLEIIVYQIIWDCNPYIVIKKYSTTSAAIDSAIIKRL